MTGTIDHDVNSTLLRAVGRVTEQLLLAVIQLIRDTQVNKGGARVSPDILDHARAELTALLRAKRMR